MQTQPHSCILFHAKICEGFILIKEGRKDIVNDSLNVVCEMLGVTVDEIKSKKRKREYVMARALFFKLVRELTLEKVSLKHIGGYVGQRDHSTVIHSLDMLQERIDQFPQLNHVYVYLKCKVMREFPMFQLTKSEIDRILTPILHEITSINQKSKYAKHSGKTLSEVRKIRKEERRLEAERQKEFDAEEQKSIHSPDQNYSYKSRHA